MGANAQTTVPTFTSGQILTADQQNQSARTGVPVFATTGTRDAGFGGTGEKTLAEGQMCYVEGTGLQTYNGTAWVTWGTAPSSGALVVVKAETAFSAASSVTADNVFTSTYTTYQLRLRYTTSTTNDISLKLRASGTAASTNYNDQYVNGYATGASAFRQTAQTQLDIGTQSIGSFFSNVTMNIYGPQLAEATTFDYANNYSYGGYNLSGISYYAGNHSTATAYDGIELFVSTGTMTGSYTIYGFAKS